MYCTNFGQPANGNIAAATGVHWLAAVVVQQQMQAGVGQVVDVEELAAGRAAAPYFYFGQAPRPGFVELAQQGRQHVRIAQVVIVAGTVEVGGHDADEVATVLSPVGFAELQVSNLSGDVRLVGRFQQTYQQRVLRNGLWGQLKVNAGGTQKQQLLNAVLVALPNGIALNQQVVGQKIGSVRIIGPNAAHFDGGQQHVLWLLLGKKVRHGSLVAQVHSLRRVGDQV